jgi:hypothetical protein
MITIDPAKDYSLSEIIELKLIPGVMSYTKIYNLVTVKTNISAKAKGRGMAEATTKYNIKPNTDKAVGTKIHGKISVKGVELIRFLNLHKLINI